MSPPLSDAVVYAPLVSSNSWFCTLGDLLVVGARETKTRSVQGFPNDVRPSIEVPRARECPNPLVGREGSCYFTEHSVRGV